MAWLVAIQILCFYHPDSPSIGANDTQQRYDFLIKGMDDQRQRLRSGIYRASGRFISDNPTLGRLDGPVTIYSAFDFNTDKLRFDRIEPIREGKITAPGAGPRETWSKKTKGGALIRLPDRTISNLDGDMISRSGKLTIADESALKPLDIRAFGLFYWTDMANIPSTTYPLWLQVLERQKPDEVVEERRGIWRVAWNFPEYGTLSLRRILWLDQNSGFSPIRTELRYRSRSMPPDSWPAPKEESETTWIEAAGTWVPKTYRLSTDRGTPNAQSYELSFDWEAVNREVPAKLFSIEDLRLPRGTLVVDTSLGSTIDVGSIGPDRKVINRSFAQPPPSSPRRSWRGWGPRLPYILTAFGIVILGLAARMRLRSKGSRGARS